MGVRSVGIRATEGFGAREFQGRMKKKTRECTVRTS